MPVCARLVYKSSVPVKVSRSASYQMKYTESNPTELHEGRCRRVNNACGTHSAQHIASSSTSFPLSSVCKSCQSCAPSRHHPWLGWHAVLFFLLFPPLFPPPTFLFPFHYVCSRLAALDPFDVSCIWYRIAWSQPIYLDESRNERNLLSLSLSVSPLSMAIDARFSWSLWGKLNFAGVEERMLDVFAIKRIMIEAFFFLIFK